MNCVVDFADLVQSSKAMTRTELPAVALLALVAATPSFHASAAPPEALTPIEARFVGQRRNCSQFLGGSAFGDSVSADYGRQLAAALGNGSRDENAVLQRIQVACNARSGGSEKRLTRPEPYRAAREELLYHGTELND